MAKLGRGRNHHRRLARRDARVRARAGPADDQPVPGGAAGISAGGGPRSAVSAGHMRAWPSSTHLSEAAGQGGDSYKARAEPSRSHDGAREISDARHLLHDRRAKLREGSRELRSAGQGVPGRQRRRTGVSRWPTCIGRRAASRGGRAQKSLEIYPRSSFLRYNYAMYAMYAGDFRRPRLPKPRGCWKRTRVRICLAAVRDLSSLAQGDALRPAQAAIRQCRAGERVRRIARQAGRADLNRCISGGIDRRGSSPARGNCPRRQKQEHRRGRAAEARSAGRSVPRARSTTPGRRSGARGRQAQPP